MTVEGSAPVVDYLSNSFKVTALFALIESLSDQRHQDFYEWLCERDVLTTFPIPNATALAKLNEEYKASFGSIRRCVAFFSRLPPERQQALCKALSIDEEPLASVEKGAKFLYDLRSKFVQEAQLVLQLRDLLTFSTFAMKGQRIVESQLSIETLLGTFEEGIPAYFNEVGVIPR